MTLLNSRAPYGKLVALICFVFLPTAFGQSSWPSYPNNTAISITSGGNVGVGATSPTAPFTVEQSAYTSGMVVLNNGTTGAPNAYPNSYTPTLVVNSSEAVGSRPLFFGYKNGSTWDALLNVPFVWPVYVLFENKR